jgi:GNAT superfamily N-acetyltransferase
MPAKGLSVIATHLYDISSAMIALSGRNVVKHAPARILPAINRVSLTHRDPVFIVGLDSDFSWNSMPPSSPPSSRDGPTDEHPSSEPSAELAIRLATPEDAEALGRLSQELLTFYGLPSRYQRSYLTHAIAKGAFGDQAGLNVLIAIAGQDAVGFLAFSEMFALATCQQSIFIQDLFVARKARGLGAGQALMQALARHARDRNVGQIDWTADPWNSKAARFYDRMGPVLKSEKIFYRLTYDRLMSIIKNDP